MTQGKASFHLLDGGLQSTSILSTARPVRPPTESLDLYQLQPCVGELTTAFKATEGRLSKLLEDRSRVGRDLHDSVLQSLYAIGLNIEAARRSRNDQTMERKEADDRMIHQINQLIHEIRGMIRELESGSVQEFDLSSELSTLCSTYEQAGRLCIKLDIQRSAVEVLTHEEEREILNIVREALSNCARHADATRVVISIRMRGARVRVSIQDDGIGFSPSDGHPRGYGLANMEARAKRLGGVLRVQSKTGAGTHVIAEFSLEPQLTSI
ncbi:sensor histidine kinase [Candidatus Nitrospira nitrificans]|uniref:histidine kinase n=1 Tax=Candidatus Nitrospira nitrificans TaxID=1742973 RepID=A0A0S4LDT0_9BACT|nr:sensor histidine kinase [Candidatus Nitrospira nitrificans]CUS35767.1 putative two-component sensor histidine kinase [Candidatus Nitrospira nitrificans]